MAFEWVFKEIDETMDVGSFDCGKEPINSYLKNHALINHRRRLSRTFVALPSDESIEIAGFYTICTAQVLFESLPKKINRGLPKYPVSAMRIGQLGVSKPYLRQGLGETLLMATFNAAIKISENVGLYVVIVDSIDEEAKGFYLKYEFQALEDKPMCLFYPMKKLLATNNTIQI